MKILLTGLVKIGYVDSIKYALEQLGHDVILVDSASFYHTASYLKRKIDKTFKYKLSDQFKQQWNENILNICNTENVDVFFSVSADQVERDTIDKLKKEGIQTWIWLLDGSARGVDFVKTSLWYDTVYTFDEYDAQWLKDEYNVDAVYLPVGYDERNFYNDVNVNRDIDICFVGMADDNRKKILEKIASMAYEKGWKMHVQGVFYSEEYFWKKIQFKRKYPNIFRYLHNNWIGFKDVGNLYRRSKICLNISTSGQKSINPRAFEIMACASVNMMNSGQSLKNFIQPNDDFLEYENYGQLLSKLAMCLADDEMLSKISNNGYIKTYNNYSMKAFLENHLNA